MRRFYGYGQKVVGSANGVVSVRPRGFGEPEEVLPSLPALGPGTVSAEFGPGGPTAPVSLARKILPWVPGMTMTAAQVSPVPFKIGGQMDTVPVSIGLTLPPGSAPPPGQQMYQCPDGMLTTDPTLCEDKASGMKKYLLPAVIAVGALVLIKML